MFKLIDVPFAQNSYLIIRGNEVVIIDPGFNEEQLIEKIKSENLKPVAMLLTHYHFDHVKAVDALATKYGIKAFLQEGDLEYILKDTLAVQFGFSEINVKKENITTFTNELNIPNFEIEVLHLPGHTPGTTCFKTKEGIFTGDFIFMDSIGRTDLPGSDPSLMKISLEKVKVWNKITNIYPGHGPDGKLEEIINANPYLQLFTK